VDEEVFVPLDPRPYSPRILSSYQADQQAKLWTRAHDYRSLVDQSQFPWEVTVRYSQTPLVTHETKLIWMAQILISAQAGAGILVSTGLLDEVKDSRLIQLIGMDRVPMTMEPHRFSSHGSEEEVRGKWEAFFPYLRETFSKNGFQDLKKTWIARWIEQKTAFGGVLP
jgi:hypothetical protein